MSRACSPWAGRGASAHLLTPTHHDVACRNQTHNSHYYCCCYSALYLSTIAAGIGHRCVVARDESRRPELQRSVAWGFLSVSLGRDPADQPASVYSPTCIPYVCQDLASTIVWNPEELPATRASLSRPGRHSHRIINSSAIPTGSHRVAGWNEAEIWNTRRHVVTVTAWKLPPCKMQQPRCSVFRKNSANGHQISSCRAHGARAV